MKLFVPDQVLDSVLDIDINDLTSRNINGLLIDLDNTLVRWEKSHLDEKLAAWVKSARTKGLQICLLSNARTRRVQKFSRLLGIPAVGKAWKPRRKAFIRGLERLGLPADQVAVVGDQLFTDVLGGNRLGLHTILINPLSPEELKTTKLVRKIEKRMMNKMVKKGLMSPLSMKVRKGRG